jgi:hypothetical protein
MTLLKQVEDERSGGLLPQTRGFTRAQAISVDWSRNDLCPHSIPISHVPQKHAARTRPGRQQASPRESVL